MIGIQIIKRMRALHSVNYIHNDLKLDNILIGKTDPQVIYLIDFGFASKFRDQRTWEHIKHVNLSYFTGNLAFASMNACKGRSKSRKDDIESMFYFISYLLDPDNLPWHT
jgi:serine/threonine protein kinase